MVAENGFWTGKRVLVTGHTGFKGGWLSLWLDRLGATVAGYSLPPPTRPSFFEVAGLESRVRTIDADVRDLAKLNETLAATRPEVVFHMAAQPLVRRSYEEPVETYATNVMGTVNVLEAVRRCPTTRAVIVVTSDKCYENREWLWGYREIEPMGGRDPYSSSKGCAELVTAAYRSSFFARPDVGVASARAGNVIGGGDWATDRIVPDLVRAVEKGVALRVRNPAAVRPWQHVLEPLGGYLLLAERLFHEPKRFAEGWNFGPLDEDARPVSWVVEQLAREFPGASWAGDPGPHPEEAGVLRLDCSKARSKLGYCPRLRLDEALRWVALWYREFLAGGDVLALSLSQIAAYEALEPGVAA